MGYWVTACGFKKCARIPCLSLLNFDGRNVIQINDGIAINVNVSVKNVMYVKKIIFRIMLDVVVETENI